MNKFKYEDWLLQFLNDDWYIQINTSENNIIFDEVYNLKTIWSQESNYYTFIENNKAALEVKDLPGFFENEEICKTKEYFQSFISGIFHLRMTGLYHVVCDFVNAYNKISKDSYNAIDENGIDVSINKAFLELTEKYYEELITLVRNTELPLEFKYCWKDLIELVKKFSKYIEKNDKLDIAYQLLEYLTNTIDGFDDLVIDLIDDLIESANKFIAVLIKYEIIFDRLILLKEHLEYQYVKSKKLPKNFYRANIIDRYQEISNFKAINEENF